MEPEPWARDFQHIKMCVIMEPAQLRVHFMLIRLLSALPFLGILAGSIFFNRVEPLIAGLPMLLAWLVLWVVLTSAIMGLIYLLDPENRRPPGGGTERSAAS